jgi:hypothetical protein
MVWDFCWGLCRVYSLLCAPQFGCAKAQLEHPGTRKTKDTTADLAALAPKEKAANLAFSVPRLGHGWTARQSFAAHTPKPGAKKPFAADCRTPRDATSASGLADLA